MNIRYETDTLHNELIATITKPNRGDEYFMDELISKVTTGIADKFIDEFYPDIRELIDTERIHANIAEEITKLGLERLRMSDKEANQ